MHSKEKQMIESDSREYNRVCDRSLALYELKNNSLYSHFITFSFCFKLPPTGEEDLTEFTCFTFSSELTSVLQPTWVCG